MKARIVDQKEFNEDFENKYLRKKHYNKHIVDNDQNEWPTGKFNNDREYEMVANLISAISVKTSDINSNDNVIGFVQKDGSCLKYRRSDDSIVIYYNKNLKNSNKLIKTFYKGTPKKYNDRYKYEYKRELKGNE